MGSKPIFFTQTPESAADPLAAGPVGRAFALAESGACEDVGHIRRRLLAEGYESVDQHLSGKLIRRQLKARLRNIARQS